MISIASTGIYRKARRLGKSLSCRTETMLTSIERPTPFGLSLQAPPYSKWKGRPSEEPSSESEFGASPSSRRSSEVCLSLEGG